jgi:hypothetical protein
MKRQAFSILYALLLLVLLGSAMLVMTHAAASVAFEADRQYVRAVGGNLQASGEAWLRVHASAPVTRPTGLDVSSITSAPASLVVAPPTATQPAVQFRAARGKHVYAGATTKPASGPTTGPT